MSPKLTTAVAVLLACINAKSVTAQVCGLLPVARAEPLPVNSSHLMPTNGAVRRQMAQPMVLPHRIKFSPVDLHTHGEKIMGATRDEGDIHYFYDGDQIIKEEIGPTGRIAGDYRYDRHGRFERLEYTDGTTIVAKYGNNGELLSLTSNTGRSVHIAYERSGDAAEPVSPTRNKRIFHSAVAVLRMKHLPSWMQGPPEENFKDASDEITPHGTTIITIVGNRDGGDRYSPIDFIPIGGSGGGRGGGGGPVSETKEAIDLIRREALIRTCLNGCNKHFDWVVRQCDTGPTWQDQAWCLGKGIEVRDKCTIACNTGDYMHRWQKDDPIPNFTPWRKPRT